MGVEKFISNGMKELKAATVSSQDNFQPMQIATDRMVFIVITNNIIVEKYLVSQFRYSRQLPPVESHFSHVLKIKTKIRKWL
jgi:hypothetical protein